MDLERDSLLESFCSEEKCKEIKQWCDEQNHKRSDIFEHRLEEGDKLREQGNEFFKKGDYETAMDRYFAAIYQVDFDVAQQFQLMDHHMMELNTRKTKMISNVCGTYLKQNDWVNTKTAAEIGLRHLTKAELTEEKDAKAKFHYRHGLANLERNFNDDAYEQLKQAAEIMPDDPAVRKALQKARERVGVDKAKAKEVYRGVLRTKEEKEIDASWWRSRLARFNENYANLSARIWNRCCKRKRKKG